MQYSSEVTNALSQKRPLVALESTIISHGLPRPKNLEVALEVEEIVRSEGATPATIAIIDGQIHVGLEKSELDRVANDENFTKASIRDLATVTATGLSAATTVAATSHIAHLAGIEYFATGGLGGVHRGAQESWDESADLLALANIPVLVVCAGVKSILDIPATLERLETLSVPVIGYRTKKFPGFYLPDSGYAIEHEAKSPAEIGAIWRARKEVGTSNSGLVVANPTPLSMNQMLHERLLKDGLTKARDNNVTGKAVTPFLLEFFHANSDGESLKVNIEIIKSNSKLAAQIASS
ncbi:MAG: pseudouridine-5'-phosphate glycosidase [Candidatus Nanopelagicaceae bacterium]|nr:pseudouridine-5'-phosphate glycosidase [Actinomycetota bacterium]NCV43371.1 pseudouridine-5'-phosphate glycosidase [Actinomycetota bacterium]NCV83134.1 pseudouridine-5'-phosphate glycosidase [Actinomycetota bacterium]NCW46734.1 pseudouridine-5'-phosphate glycosidase [Actinomycetota bacterium]NCW93395.1 pseudouridine-5'-phosphate glycosidase [Actinomycetota bacterium]